MAEDTKKPQETVINTSTVIGSTYAQLINVTINDLEVTLEFAYIHPRDPKQGQVVARITMPKEVGLQIPGLIVSVNKFHEKKKEGKQNG